MRSECSVLVCVQETFLLHLPYSQRSLADFFCNVLVPPFGPFVFLTSFPSTLLNGYYYIFVVLIYPDTDTILYSCKDYKD